MSHSQSNVSEESPVGHVYAEIELSNPRQDDLAPIAVRALADTGALVLCIPKHIAIQLCLETDSTRPVTFANGQVEEVPYVGPIRVRFGRRSCYVGALVMGDGVLLGAVPMEDMDLVIDPARRTVSTHPESPNFPRARA